MQVVAGAEIAGHKTFRTVLLFAPQPYYIIFTKSNLAAEELPSMMPWPVYWQKILCMRISCLNRYVAGKGSEMYALTQQEKTYLATHPVLKIAVIKNDQPYFSMDKDGTSPRECWQTFMPRFLP
jgi:hypothetical protein